jgi:hypothetical protein
MAMTIILVILWIITALLGWVGEVWKGAYHGNSSPVKSSAQFWFMVIAALTLLFTIMKFAA